MYKKHWEEFIQGNNAALIFVYEPLFQPLLFVALKYVRNTEVAQDITSELFTSLLEADIVIRQTKWSQIRDIPAFLSTIIKCRALDHLKLVKNRQRLLNENLTPSSYTDEKRKEELAHLNVCILQLSLEEQKLVQLHLAGYKNDEIAEKQNYSEKTVRNKLSLSRKKLIYLWKNLILILVWQL
jgi:RNA polymerase sigma-70 factor (ECF subfamily)